MHLFYFTSTKQEGKNLMQIFTSFNEKGGVGKSTIAALLGGGLAMRGNRVCLIDADGQGDLSTNMKVKKQGGFYDMIKRNDPQADNFVPTKELLKRPPEDKHPEGLYIVPGNNETWGIPGSTNLRDIVTALNKRLLELSRVFDYVIIDTQPSASTLHDAIALVTDYFIVPTDTEPLSAYGGLKSALAHIEGVREQSLLNNRDKAKLLCILPNKFDARTKLHQHVLKTLHDEYGKLVWQPIPKRINISEAQFLQTTLMMDAPELETNDYIWEFVDRVIESTKETAHG
jgi:chromosome partitioning protein